MTPSARGTPLWTSTRADAGRTREHVFVDTRGPNGGGALNHTKGCEPFPAPPKTDDGTSPPPDPPSVEVPGYTEHIGHMCQARLTSARRRQHLRSVHLRRQARATGREIARASRWTVLGTAAWWRSSRTSRLASAASRTWDGSGGAETRRHLRRHRRRRLHHVRRCPHPRLRRRRYRRPRRRSTKGPTLWSGRHQQRSPAQERHETKFRSPQERHETRAAAWASR